MMIIGVIIGDEVGVEIEDPVVEVEDETQDNRDDRDRGGNRGEYKQGYNDNRGQGQDSSSRGVENSGIIIMTIGIEARTDKAVVGERNGTEVEVKVMGIEVGVADGTHMNNTLPKDIPQVHIIKILITIARHLWVIRARIQQ